MPQPAPVAQVRPAPAPQPVPAPAPLAPAAPAPQYYEPAAWPTQAPQPRRQLAEPAHAPYPGQRWEAAGSYPGSMPGAPAAPQGWGPAGAPPTHPGQVYRPGAPARRSWLSRMFNRTGRHSAVDQAAQGPVWPAAPPAAELMWVGPQSPTEIQALAGTQGEAGYAAAPDAGQPTLLATGGRFGAAPGRGESRRKRPAESPRGRGKESRR